jgi:hypothetical protein
MKALALLFQDDEPYGDEQGNEGDGYKNPNGHHHGKAYRKKPFEGVEQAPVHGGYFKRQQTVKNRWNEGKQDPIYPPVGEKVFNGMTLSHFPPAQTG